MTTPSSTYGHPVSAPRRLLARVRDVMSGAAGYGSRSAEERLQQVVEVIATDMVAEVCSAYVRRAGDQLELYATQGLKPSAVHTTRLYFGEGIIGDIAASARPFALSDAQEHPNFAYRPETGEEVYHSMMGVPVLRAGRVVGVLAVQNRTRRQYTEEEVETLQTVAMVLAELIGGGELVDRRELQAGGGPQARPLRVDGLELNGGLGIGQAVLHLPKVQVDRLVAEDPDEEMTRLHAAFKAMHGELDNLLESEALAAGGEHRDVLETYRLIADDAGWLTRIEDGISSGLTAEAAVQRVQNDIRARMGQVSDPYLRERVADLDDLAYRLIGHLTGESGEAAAEPLPEQAVLIARNMGPAQLLDYDPERLVGLVLEEGSPASHVAIIARALDIPVIGHARDVLSTVDAGDTVVVDATHGHVYLRPSPDILNAFEAGLRSYQEERERYAELRDKPAVTVDGQDVELHINAGLMVDMPNLERSGAVGVGLFRTEVAFMARSKFLGVDEQTELYTQVLDGAEGKPVTFRTLDIGGDKVLPHWGGADGENPAMGWRAIRVSLDRPALLRQQLRGMIRAAAGRELKVMFPMVAEVAEFNAARALLDKEWQREKGRGNKLPEKLAVGAMLEVPSLAFQLPALLKVADFVAVGSNDLGQFLFAQDRGDARLAGRYDMLSPIILKFFKGVVEQCDAAGVPVSLCGEMAGRPLEAMALVGVGFRRMSMAATAVGRIKAVVRALDAAALAAFVEELLDSPEHTIRDRLEAFAGEHDISL
jgi:phosphotransferase system enzyme I (PtsP)